MVKKLKGKNGKFKKGSNGNGKVIEVPNYCPGKFDSKLDCCMDCGETDRFLEQYERCREGRGRNRKARYKEVMVR